MFNPQSIKTMKKIFAAVFLLSMALQAGAQGWTDALNLSENDYLGTARSVGMGNAMTAVGGDLGSLTFNPAGSAVASYSQFTITPGLSFSTVTAQGSLSEGFEDAYKTRKGRMGLPNFGAMMTYDTRNKRGLKRVTFGIVGNVTRDYTNKLRASGTNANTTLAGSLASQADGFGTDVLDGGFYQSSMPSWETMVGWQGGLFEQINGSYVGITESLLDNGNIVLTDRIGQYYGLERKGSKYDLLMNFGMDFNDKFYLGANIGITTATYRSDETRSEEALSGNYGNDFAWLRTRSTLNDDASGIYAKIGFIARPFSGFRVGAAIQTPTLMQVREGYQLEGRSLAEGIEMSQSSPWDEWFYNVTSPWRANVGVAYTIGQLALVSADYEYTDYRGMKLSPSYDDAYYYDFTDANLDIQDFTGPVHAIRLGAELKPAPSLALRVGYNLTTGAQYNTLSDSGHVVALSQDERIAQLRTAVSFGVGYSSPGSFFADFAVRFQYLPNEYFTPYWYYYRENGNLYTDYSVVTPEICAQSALCNALLTLGWRF
jgi:hypothetical protein